MGNTFTTLPYPPGNPIGSKIKVANRFAITLLKMINKTTLFSHLFYSVCHYPLKALKIPSIGKSTNIVAITLSKYSFFCNLLCHYPLRIFARRFAKRAITLSKIRLAFPKLNVGLKKYIPPLKGGIYF